MFKTFCLLIICVNIVVIHANHKLLANAVDIDGQSATAPKTTKSTPQPIILFNNDDNGISYDFITDDTNQSVIVSENATKLYSPENKIKSLDIDIDGKYFVWSSGRFPYPIYMAEYRTKLDDQNPARLRMQVYKRSVIVSENTQTDVAIDWVHNLVYYFNATNLFVIDVRNPEVPYAVTNNRPPEHRSRISYVADNKTGNIAVNPYESFVVWTEYNLMEGMAVIRRCNEDGSDPMILVYKDLTLPICLAIDFSTKTILWIDNELHSLSSIDYMGNNRKSLKQSKQLFSDCSSMDVFNGSIYWSSPKEDKIMRLSLAADVLAESAVQTVVTSELDIDFVKIMSADKQLIGEHYCQNNTCAHQCLPNGNGGHRCLCSETSQLNPCKDPKQQFQTPAIPELKANTTAIAALMATGEPLLLFAGRKRDLRLARLSTATDRPMYYIESEFMYKMSQYITSVDYSLTGNFLVGIKSDSIYVSKTQLFVAPVLESTANTISIGTGIKTLFNTTEKTVAVDWVHNLAYYPACGNPAANKGIYVVNLTAPGVDQRYKIIGMAGGCLIKDIRVDPVAGLIFWSDFNDNVIHPTNNYGAGSYGRNYNRYSIKSQIWRAGQDGSDQKMLVESPLVRRNTLTLDMADKRIYWIDMQKILSSQCSLSTVKYDGTDRRVVHAFSDQFKDHVIAAMDLFGDHIYWTDGENNTILRISKHKEREASVTAATPVPTLVLQSGVDVEAVKIIHSSRQPNATNKCVGHTCGHFSALCLPVATGSPGYTCGCPGAQTWNGSACLGQPPTAGPDTTQSAGNRPVTTPSVSSAVTPYPVLDNDTKLVFVVYKEGIYVKQNLEDMNTQYLESVDLLSDTDWITEFDYVYHKNVMLWLESSVFEGLSLYGAPIDRSKPSAFNATQRLLRRTYNSKRLSIDWIHDLAYISVSKGVEVISIGPEGKYYSYDLIRHNEIQGDVSVDPIHGLLLWSQWGYNTVTTKHSGSIMRANQDGSDPVVLSTATKIPNTIALDIDAQIVYWIDTHEYTLYSVSYTGLDLKTILVSRNLFEGSFSMDLFGDHIYWSNYENNALHVTNKRGLNGTERLTLVNAYTDIEGIKVLDSRRQMNGTNRCSNSRCAHMCLPVQRDYRCVCSKNKYYFSDVCNDETTTTARPVMTSTGMTTTTAATTLEPIGATDAIHSQLIDHNIHYMKNISHKLDSLINITQLRPETDGPHNGHWIAIAFISMAVNVILIAIFIYRKKQIKFPDNFWAKFRKDRGDILMNDTSSVNDEL